MPDPGDLTIEEALEEALDRVTHPGTFCASGSAPIILPGLNVKGVGPTGLPLAGPQVEALKARAEQAPWGPPTPRTSRRNGAGRFMTRITPRVGSTSRSTARRCSSP